MEWMKLYGLLMNRETEADAYFTTQSEKLDSILTEKNTGKTVAFFYITTNGSVNIRKPGDYTSKMIELAGGNYLFSAEDLNVEENALSTMNIQMETFYAVAKDADYLIYNAKKSAFGRPESSQRTACLVYQTKLVSANNRCSRYDCRFS